MKYFIPTCSVRKASAIAMVFLLLIGVSSCKKDSNSEYGGETVVRIQMVGTESDEGNNPLNNRASSSTKGGVSAGPQVFTLSFGNDMMVTATLEEVDRAGNPIAKQTVLQRASANGSGNKAAIERNPLGNGIKYGILVYDEEGDLIAEKEYTHGNGYSSEQDTIGGLTAGKTYTFVGYSINSTTDLPVIEDKETLADVKTALTDQDLMIFKEDQQINEGSNTLQVVLKHKFIEILPSISIATTVNPNTGVPVWGGQIDAIGGMSIDETFEQGAVKISDIGTSSEYSFSSNTVDKPVSFPAIPSGGTTSLTATQPILVISPETVAGNFTINGLVINGITDDLFFDEMRLEPGKKYNLKLAFNSPCIEEVGAEGFWRDDHSERYWSSWDNLPDADFGFLLDIHTLDNSVNLEVNNQSIVETRRVFQYRTRSLRTGNWGQWQTVTSPTTTRNTTRTVGSSVSFPLYWDWTAGDLDFQQSAKAGEDFAINNVRFADGDIYGGPQNNEGGSGNIEPLWNDTYWNGVCCIANGPSPNGPIIKIQIVPDGSVKVFGKRTVNGPHEQMEIISEQTSMTKYYYNNSTNNQIELNPDDSRVGSHLREERAILYTRVNPEGIEWYSGTTPNTVRASQRIVNRTWMYARGYGVKRVVCQ